MTIKIPRRLNNYVVKEDKRDNQTIFALCIIFFVPAINNFINSFLQIGLSVDIFLLTPVSYIFMAIISVVFLYRFLFRKKFFIWIFLFFLFGSFISYFIYPEIRSAIYSSPVDLVYSPVNKLLFFCFPTFLGTVCLTNYNKLFEAMRIWSLITSVLGILTYVFVTIIQGEILQYMVYSYFLLLPSCVCFEYANMKNTKIDFILAIISSITMVACGARGAIVALLLYFFICFSRYNLRRLTYSQIIKLLVALVCIIIIMLFYNEILNLIENIFNYFNIDSRVIHYLQTESFLEDSGRHSISNSIVRGLISNPLGYGLYGDRYVAHTFGSSNNRYAHNIFLELLCDFGILGGAIVIILLALIILNLIKTFKGKKEIHLIFALIPYALFQLLFSSSYLENIPFFALVGLAISCIINKRVHLATGELNETLV